MRRGEIKAVFVCERGKVGMEVTAVQRTRVRQENTVLAELLTPIRHSKLRVKRTSQAILLDREWQGLHMYLHIHVQDQKK